MSKIKIICDGSVGRSGVILHGHVASPRLAYDSAKGHAPAPKWDYLDLHPGVNEVEIDPVKLEAFQAIARDAGLTIVKAPSNVYVVTDHLSGANDGIRFPNRSRPNVARDKRTLSTLDQALSSNRVICAR